jgi:uncharacterized protein YukE
MELSLDYNKAQRQAQSLEQCAEDMLRQSREVGSIIADIRRVWQGETANAYIRKLQTLETELRENANKCSKDAIDFRSKIRAVRTADEEAQRAMESI